MERIERKIEKTVTEIRLTEDEYRALTAFVDGWGETCRAQRFTVETDNELSDLWDKAYDVLYDEEEDLR